MRERERYMSSFSAILFASHIAKLRCNLCRPKSVDTSAPHLSHAVYLWYIEGDIRAGADVPHSRKGNPLIRGRACERFRVRKAGNSRGKRSSPGRRRVLEGAGETRVHACVRARRPRPRVRCVISVEAYSTPRGRRCTRGVNALACGVRARARACERDDRERVRRLRGGKAKGARRGTDGTERQEGEGQRGSAGDCKSETADHRSELHSPPSVHLAAETEKPYGR